MKNKAIINKAIALLLVCVMMLFTLASCFGSGDANSGNGINDKLDNIDTSFAGDDLSPSYSEDGATIVKFSNGSVEINGKGANANGTDLLISGSGTFIISGSCQDGSIEADIGKGKEAIIVLDGLTLHNSDGPVIYITSGKKVTLTLADGTENVLSDEGGYSITDGTSTVDGVIFSKSNLVINGKGSLSLNAKNFHGIVSKDSLTICGGNINVSAVGAGICGKDSLKITDATVKVSAGSDALRADNSIDEDLGYIYIQSGTFDLTANNDGLDAFSIVRIDGGSFTIKTLSALSTESSKAIKGGEGIAVSGGEFNIDSQDDALHSNGDIAISGGSFIIDTVDDGIHTDNTLEISGGNIDITNSYEGIEATDIIISGGYIDITSTDDGMNAAGGNDSNTGVTGRPGGDMFGSGTGSIKISGGYTIIHSEGDGVDSNNSIEISGGIVLVDGPSRGGNSSLDYNSSAKITGGVVIALGTSDMAQNFSEAEQGSILVGLNGSASSGTVLSLCDENGNVILAFTSTKSFSCALFSAPEINNSGTYSVYMNATISGLDKNGFAHNTTQEGGTLLGSLTMSGYIYGQTSGMGGRPTRPR